MISGARCCDGHTEDCPCESIQKTSGGGKRVINLNIKNNRDLKRILMSSKFLVASFLDFFVLFCFAKKFL